MLYPQDNRCRDRKELGGLWGFRTDPGDRGEELSWQAGFPEQRLIAVPSSWNDQFQNLRNYFGSVWYQNRFYSPRGWKDQRVWLRIGSANYWADVWVNGAKVGAHEGGHLPFEFDITPYLQKNGENTLVIRVNGTLNLETVPWGMVPDPGSSIPTSTSTSFRIVACFGR
jgi:beta-glucuronidase